ncbi:MAG: MFS transporter [Verrucomicrobiota bacterium]|jgi:MFS family permease
MREPRSTSPITFFFLVLPCGISSGFVSVTLPFALTSAGFPVATTASILAIGMSAYVWRFLWAPVADLTLTLRRWYLVGLVACSATLLLLGLTPLRQNAAGILTAMVFLSQVAATLVVLPLGGLMAHTVVEQEKGRAAGWYQGGNLGGAGIGGGAGVWLASHFSNGVASAVLSAAMLICAAALYFVPEVRTGTERLGQKMREIGRDFRDMLRSPIVLLTIFLFASPIGIGAASNLWSAVAPDWHAGPNTVALVTGFFNGLACVLGCVVGGWLADRVGRWWVFFGSGTIMALVGIIMAAAPRSVVAYASGVLFYAFSMGLAYAAFTALALHAIGRGAASAKYAILVSLGNVPCSYMTAFDGWMHDRFGSAGMLNSEALLGLGCILVGLLVLRQIKGNTPTQSPMITETAG